MKKIIPILLVLIMVLPLVACGNKPQMQQSNETVNESGQASSPIKKSISVADFNDALLAAGYMNESTFRSEYKKMFGDTEIDEIDDYDDVEWLEDSGTRIPALLRGSNAKGALMDINHQIAFDYFDPKPQQAMCYAVFTEDYDPDNIDDSVELIMYFKFSSESEAADFYGQLAKEFDTTSQFENTCIVYSGKTNSPAWKAMQALGY